MEVYINFLVRYALIYVLTDSPPSGSESTAYENPQLLCDPSVRTDPVFSSKPCASLFPLNYWKQQASSAANEEIDGKPRKERIQAADAERAEVEQTGGVDTAGAAADGLLRVELMVEKYDQMQ
ncbi:hypothetical protein E5288_WYG017737 [Bos mutus]|uniref:Uncharacterized protein n=1 Tax=Bos mutus TaxID=72004 RepID=A0A6B0RJT8_9CETA|nr:hypothetical protein [Bos mutus]